MEKEMETILDRCLDQMRKGKRIEECLGSYPQFASELKPLLLLARDVEKTPKPEPRKEAINLALMRVGEAVSAARGRRPFLERISLRHLLVRPVLAGALSLALILMFVGWTVGMLAADSLPGDSLYLLKLTTEKVKFFLTWNAGDKAELRMEFSRERLGEFMRTVQERGALDKSLLMSLLEEAELALDEARPVDEDTFRLLAARLDHFTAYQEVVLEQLKPRVPDRDRANIDEAIDLCRNRCQCLKRMAEQKELGEACRRWGPGCRCRDLKKTGRSLQDTPQ